MGKLRRAFTPEFRREAVRVVTDGGRSVTEVARELDIRPELLHTWRRKLESEEGVSSPKRVPSVEDENRRLRRENRILRMERDFLKKAAAFFANGSGGSAP